MTNRNSRRAAARQAAKAAAKAAKLQSQSQPVEAPPIAAEAPKVMTASAGAAADVSEPSSPTVDFADEIETPSRPISEAQLAANRANAQKSTGPLTLAGRAKSSLNAIKTGLTGQTVLLPTDDAAAYQAHLDRHFTRYAPASDEEHTLVQMIADAEWRILRIPSLESSIYALGRRKLADLHPDETDPAVRQALIQGEIQIAYRRDLSNLALQERRLRNQHKSDLEKLQALQTERLEKKNEKGKIQQRMCEAIRSMVGAVKIFGHFDPAAFGFEFSIAEINYCHQALESAGLRGQTPPCVADMLANFRGAQNQPAAA